MKIQLSQIEIHSQEIERMTDHILAKIAQAKEQCIDCIAFPELCNTGYLIGDQWEQDNFLTRTMESNYRIAAASEDIVVIWGSIDIDRTRIGNDGRVRKYNAGYIAQQGNVIKRIYKNNLPKYRIFDDARHFYPAHLYCAEQGIELNEYFTEVTVDVKGKPYRIGVTICEDLWEDEYAHKLSTYYTKRVDALFNLSFSPFTEKKSKARERMLLRRVQTVQAPILYVACVGIENNAKNIVCYDGGTCVTHPLNGVTHRTTDHLECDLTYELGALDVSKPSVDTNQPPFAQHAIHESYEALIASIKRYYRSIPAVIIGVSGGIDSAVNATLHTLALGQDRVHAYNLPTKHNTLTTRGLAQEWARLNNVPCLEIDIDPIIDATTQTLTNAGFQLKELTRENIQARARSSTILAAIAQEYDGVFTCNGNKTEFALNYFTMYGDGAGANAFLGDFWKTEIYELAHYINRRFGTLIPEGIIQIIPTAELSDDQNPDKGLGDPILYDWHDVLLRHFVELRKDLAWITSVLDNHPLAEVDKVLGLPHGTTQKYFATKTDAYTSAKWAWDRLAITFKRAQSPQVFIRTRRSFGFDLRESIR